MPVYSTDIMECGQTVDGQQNSPAASRPNCVARSTSGWFEEEEQMNPKDVTSAPAGPDAVRMDAIDDYEKELETELAERIDQLTTTDISENDHKGILAAARSRDLYKKHVHRINEKQQKVRAEDKKIVRNKPHAHRAEHEQRGSYTGSSEEQRRAGCQIVSKQHSVDLEDDAGQEEARLMALLRMKQLGRQSWQDLDEVGSFESPPSKLDDLEHGVQSPTMFKPVKIVTCP